MRVPTTFKYEVDRIKKKRGYENTSEFLHKEVVPLLQNSDMLSDSIQDLKSIFGRKK